MNISVSTLRRVVDDVDWSDLFDARQTGPAEWVVDQPGILNIPFDRDLTPDEVTLAQRRLESEDADEETMVTHIDQFLDLSDAFLNNTSPTNADAIKQLRLVTRAVEGLIKIQRRNIIS